MRVKETYGVENTSKTIGFVTSESNINSVPTLRNRVLSLDYFEVSSTYNKLTTTIHNKLAQNEPRWNILVGLEEMTL